MKNRSTPFPAVILLAALAVLLPLVLAACSSNGGANSSSPNGASGSPGQPGGPAAFQRDAFNRYSAEFRVQFQGSSSWLYQLKTRRSPEQREFNLHQDGLDPAKNPGDIRMLTDGQQTWMLGPGTENQCLQFPNNQGMDPTYIQPEDLLDLAALGGALKKVGEEPSSAIPEAGAVTLVHYRAEGVSAGGWQKATVEYWADKASGMLYRYNFQAEGADPFFETGSGRISASYQVAALGDQPFEPVAGCEINVPLPENARAYVRLPGLASFDSPDGVETLQQYYQTVMVQQNWTESQPPAQQNGATVLSYTRDGQAVQVVLEPLDNGCRVKLLLGN